MLRSSTLSAAAALVLCTAAIADPPLQASLFVSGVNAPTYLCAPPGDTSRVFITEQNTARVRLVLNGTLQATPFLDIGAIANSGFESGLLGLAFHPDYATNRRFYVSYTDNSNRSVIREYLRDAGNPNVADASTARTIIGPIVQPFLNHNGGCIQFGPDGYLYFGLGDGGSANDPGNRSQTLTTLMGKMLRIDVDNDDFPGDPNVNYAVPADNPFVGLAGLDEIWAYGLRNPWRFSFDRATGDLYIGDVGQNAVEEVSWAPASSTGGENYGWRCMEGTSCTGLSGCTCNDPALTDPIQTVTHAGGNCSLTGGYVYRGNKIPGLQGRYIFGDFCSGRVWSIRWDPVTMTTNFVNHTVDLSIPGGENISSFGEDAEGEIYIVDQNGGEVWKIEAECVDPADCQQSFCDGFDLALNQCPCGNAGAPESGCDIQQATGGVQLQVVDQDTLNTRITLQGTGFPAMSTPAAVVIRSPNLDAGGAVVFGDGLRCVGLPVVRLGAAFASGGTATHTFGHGAGPGAFYYQEWFRNTPAAFCTPDAFNLSNGVSALW